MRLTRKRFGLVGLAILAAASIAIAGEGEVINFAGPGAINAGETYAASVTVNQAPMSVTFTSSPAGLVSYTTTVSSTTQSVNVPTSGFAAPGSYTITASPTAGGKSKSRAVAVATP